MKSKKTKEKIGWILIIIVFLGIIPCCFLALFWPKFKVQSFESFIEIPLSEAFQQKSGSVCYGNTFDCKEVTVEEEGEVDTQKPGEYKITYTYKYENKDYKKEQIVKVVDKEPPVLEIEDQEFYYCENKTVPEYKVSAIDNYDGDISKEVKKSVKDGKIIFSAKDTSGNETTIEKEAIEKDIEIPKITILGGEKVFLKRNEEYEELGADALDNCDGDLSEKVEIEGNVDSKKVGVYKITYRVKDSSGNEAVKTKEVHVEEEKKQEINGSGKIVYLTFDDGPSKYTNELLDILKKYDVKATFFVTNQTIAQPYDDCILRAYKEGHTIGLHSYSHDYNIYETEETYFEDLYKIQEKVKKITGYTSNIIRFPGGSSNTISKNYDNGKKIMTKLTKSVEEKGFRYFDWNVISGDAGETKDTNEIVAHVITEIGKFKNSMILQHDIKDYSVKAVESIIEFGLTHGFKFLSITEDTPDFHHRVNN